ncbi:MAG: alpha/beta fold hydrolase [Acidobacteriota bacterium]
MTETDADGKRRERRRSMVRALLLATAAIGVPAAINRLVQSRASNLPDATWGSRDVYRWRHGDIAFQQLGEGPPVVLVHSFGPGNSAAEWRRVAEELDSGFEVFAPDLLGWGRSDKPRTAYDAQLYVLLLRDFLRQVVQRPAVLVAAGLPAAYAAQLAADHPELVSLLGLVTPEGLGVHDRRPALADRLLHRALRTPVLGTAALNLATSRAAIANALRDEVYASSRLVDQDLVELHYTHAHRPRAHLALSAYWAGLLDLDVRRALDAVRQPVWLAWGRRAGVPAIEAADLWLRRLDEAELEVFEQTALVPHAESPGELARRLERWILDRLPPSHQS